MITIYRYTKDIVKSTYTKFSKVVTNKLGGICLVSIGILSVLFSGENGCYDITAALFLVPVGMVMILGRSDQ